MPEIEVLVVRVYRGAAAEHVAANIAGKIEVVRTGKELIFRSLDELMNVLRAQLSLTQARRRK